VAVSKNDMYQLSQEPTFQNRVQASLVAACIAISNEGWAIPFHRERSDFVVRVLGNPNGTVPNWVALFSNAVVTDSNVIGDATVGGTVPITLGNRATQAALVTDAHIDAAVSSMFNSFVREPAN
jgi:hypothetical protein